MPRSRVSIDQRLRAWSRNGPAAGVPGSASHTSGARRGRSASRGPTLDSLVEEVGGEHQVERPPLDEFVRPRPVDGRGLEVHAVRLGAPLDQRQGLLRVVGGEHGRARARRGEARRGEPAPELDHALPAVRPAPSTSRARATLLRQSTDQYGDDRRPLDVPHVGKLGRLLRLEQAKLPARQVDRLGDQVLGHRPSLGGFVRSGRVPTVPACSPTSSGNRPRVLLAGQLLGVLLYPFMEDSEVGQALFSLFGIAILGLVVLAVRSTRQPHLGRAPVRAPGARSCS